MRSAILGVTAIFALAGAAMPQGAPKPPAANPAQARPGAAKAAPKAQPPAPGPLRPFKFPAFETKKLANGLTVFVVEDHRQPLVSFSLVLPAGNITADPKKAGLAEITAQLLRQGTATRSAQEIAKAVDRTGGSLGASANDDNAQINGSFMKSYAGEGFEMLADILMNPAFKQEELDRMRRQALSGLQVQWTDPEYIAPLAAARAIYGEHPYAYPNDGTPETLQGLKREDIIEFHKRRYAPGNSFLAIAGDVTPAEAYSMAEKYLGKWQAEAASPAAVKNPPEPKRQVLIVDKPDAVQTQIVVGELAIPRNDPDYIPLLIANQIFGGSFNSRLNMKLRANEGLTYGARSSFETQRVTGSFVASTFTRTEKTGTAIRFLLDLLKEYGENPGTAAEIAEAKAFLTGSFAIGTETPAQVAGRVLTVAVHGLPMNYWDTYRDAIQAVTPEQLSAAVRRRLDPAKVAIVAVGSAKGFAKELEAMGPARTISLSDLDIMSPDLKRAVKTAAPASAETKQQGRAIIEAAAKAAGGAQALAGVKNSSSKAKVKLTMSQGKFDADLTEEVLYPDKYRANLSLAAMGQMTQAFDGAQAWMAQGGKAMPMPAAAIGELKRNILLAGCIGILREALDGRAEVQALPAVELEGKKMDAVLWTAGEDSIQLLFDPETHLAAKASYRSTGPSGNSDIAVLWSDYRETAGLKTPWKQVTLMNGQPYMDQTVSEVKFNTGIEPSGFNMP